MNKFFVLILVAPLPALAEVSDKMPSIPQLWLQGLIVAAGLLLLTRWFIWFSILGALVVAFFFWASWETFAAPYVGPGILREQGMPYVLSSYGSMLLMVAGLIIGVAMNRRKKTSIQNGGTSRNDA